MERPNRSSRTVAGPLVALAIFLVLAVVFGGMALLAMGDV